ncbi:MAG: hypothetical protein R3234_13465 [Thermoanaerobaculia bacterium]|nr:hypothetical protein [Thermoanaerobaculia bacterium]
MSSPSENLEASFADGVLNELFPEELEWERLVPTYPRICLGAAAAAGFWLGWKRGDEVLEAIGRFAVDQMERAVGDHLEP